MPLASKNPDIDKIATQQATLMSTEQEDLADTRETGDGLIIIRKGFLAISLNANNGYGLDELFLP